MIQFGFGISPQKVGYLFAVIEHSTVELSLSWWYVACRSNPCNRDVDEVGSH